jgi:hypothetical protein
MTKHFYERTGKLISPGDIFEILPYVRVPSPLRVARKIPYTLKEGAVQGELREILEVGRHKPDPDFDFNPPGEDVLSNGKMSRAIFLTWGSEVEGDERAGNLHKKEWLIAPVFPLSVFKGKTYADPLTGDVIDLVEAVRGRKSPKYFPLEPLPGEEEAIGHYVDFRRICALAATHFQNAARTWRLGPPALNEFYHQLIWFFTRREIFFQPVQCNKCGARVDLNVIFEGQPVNPE